MGFPGEGPSDEPTRSDTVWIGSANATHWSSFLAADLWQGGDGIAPCCWCVQETKLATKADERKARGIADAQGWSAKFSKAARTAKEGVSGGAGVFWNRRVCTSDGVRLRGRDDKGRWAISDLELGGLRCSVASLHGDCYDPDATRLLL